MRRKRRVIMSFKNLFLNQVWFSPFCFISCLLPSYCSIFPSLSSHPSPLLHSFLFPFLPCCLSFLPYLLSSFIPPFSFFPSFHPTSLPFMPPSFLHTFLPVSLPPSFPLSSPPSSHISSVCMWRHLN